MARYKDIDTSPRFLALNLEAQLLPGTFEHALCWLIDQEIDLSGLDAHYTNDLTGAKAYPPAMLLKIVLFTYSRGIVARLGTSPSNALSSSARGWFPSNLMSVATKLTSYYSPASEGGRVLFE